MSSQSHTNSIARARVAVINGQVPTAEVDVTQEEWLTLRGLGLTSFGHAAIFLDDSVPLSEYNIRHHLDTNRDLTAERYVRSYLRWFDTRRIQISPRSVTVDATEVRWASPRSNRAQNFPSREVIMTHRLRHMYAICFAVDMRAASH